MMTFFIGKFRENPAVHQKIHEQQLVSPYHFIALMRRAAYSEDFFH
jgi:hypothetical protein